MTADLATLKDLHTRVREATGQDRTLDADLCVALQYVPYQPGAFNITMHPEWAHELWFDVEQDGHDGELQSVDCTRTAPALTGSIDAAFALVKRLLPGWSWRLASCHVSDDAWVVPDVYDPAHRARLEPLYGREDAMAVWTEITDVDRRPPGNPALALLESLLAALIAIAEREATDAA